MYKKCIIKMNINSLSYINYLYERVSHPLSERNNTSRNQRKEYPV